MPVMARSHARTCSPRCRQRASRSRRALSAEMTSRRRWVRRDERKVPLTADTGRPASSTDPATWSDYAAARDSRVGSGLGYVLAEGDGIVCIDLDHCIDADGELAGWAREILDRCPPTMVETSPSGTGLHIWGRGHVPHGRRIRKDGAAVEIYGQGRYIALGRRYADSPAELADLSEVIHALT